MDGLKAILILAAIILVFKNIEVLLKVRKANGCLTDSMRLFTFERQYHFDPKIPKWFFMRKGQKVRFVMMNGCMAHIRSNVEEGTVIGFVKKNLYDGSVKGYDALMARIKFADRTVEWVAEPSEWFPNEQDGVLERRY